MLRQSFVVVFSLTKNTKKNAYNLNTKFAIKVMGGIHKGLKFPPKEFVQQRQSQRQRQYNIPTNGIIRI